MLLGDGHTYAPTSWTKPILRTGMHQQSKVKQSKNFFSLIWKTSKCTHILSAFLLYDSLVLDSVLTINVANKSAVRLLYCCVLIKLRNTIARYGRFYISTNRLIIFLGCYIILTSICDRLWENPPFMYKYKHWEICISVIQSVIPQEGLKLHAYNLLWIYSY